MAAYTFPGQHEHKGIILQATMKTEIIDRIPNMEVVPGDVLVATYPKTGTTWMEELTWLITTNGDFNKANSIPLHDRVLFLEHTMGLKLSGLERLASLPRPCIMKTHLPMEFFTNHVKEGILKVILVIRNPKDTLVSFYYFYKMNKSLGNFTGTWDQFFELYKAKPLFYGDYFDWYKNWLEFMDRPNVLLVKYEDMKHNMHEVVNKICTFLKKPLDDDTMEKIVTHTSFDNMKVNKMTNLEALPTFKNDISPFMRKGTVGDWKNHFNEEQSNLIDKHYTERLAGMVELQFVQKRV